MGQNAKENNIGKNMNQEKFEREMVELKNELSIVICF